MTTKHQNDQINNCSCFETDLSQELGSQYKLNSALFFKNVQALPAGVIRVGPALFPGPLTHSTFQRLGFSQRHLYLRHPEFL